jgi:YD repeat-containing protein
MPAPGVQGADVTRRWRSYAAAQHILRDVSVDADGTPLEPDAAANTSTYVLLSERGRPLISAQEAGAGALLRSDYQRDTHGNARSYRQTLTTTRGVSASPPELPSVAYDFVNHYDASSGLLLKHNRSDGSAGINYTHDANGRCESISDEVSIERRQYDSNGRLASRQLDALDPLTLVAAASSVTTYRYDEQGRPLAIEEDGGGPGAQAPDGKADVLIRWSYADDEAAIVEYIDYGSDTPNDTVERDGQPLNAMHRWESWSPGCEAVQAELPVAGGEACVTE